MIASGAPERPMVAGEPWDAFLAGRRVAVLATNGPDGLPHAVPVEVVVRGGLVYVWARRTSRKARNAGREGRASLVGYKGNDGVLVRGPVRMIGLGEPGYAEIADAFLAKYERAETYGNDVIVEISPGRVTTFG